jgi:hypothetical protein
MVRSAHPDKVGRTGMRSIKLEGRLGCLGAVLLLATARPCGSQTASAPVDRTEFSYRISSERLQCLRKNRAKYLKMTGDPLLIVPDLCPRIPANPILETLVAEGPKPDAVRDMVGPDTLLYLRRSKLRCLLSARATSGVKLYRFVPALCQLEPAL